MGFTSISLLIKTEGCTCMIVCDGQSDASGRLDWPCIVRTITEHSAQFAQAGSVSHYLLILKKKEKRIAIPINTQR